MPRPYHSPSSIALGLTCQYAWAKTYIDKERDPDLAWSDRFLEFRWDHASAKFVHPRTREAHTAQQRGAALGKGMHATAERWYEPARGAPDWHWYPGVVFASGKHHLPEPSKIERVVIEQPIGTVEIDAGHVTRALPVHGILWSGFIDNEAHGGDELARLGIKAPDGVAIVDYKSSSSIEKFALTPDELLFDPQAALYAIATAQKLGIETVPERWVYFESKKIRRAIAVDVTAELSRALDVIGPCSDLARVLDMITYSADAPKNPAMSMTENGVRIPACNKYGPPDRINCRFHQSNGGTCDARPHSRALAQLKPKWKEENRMALTAEQEKVVADRKAKFAAKKAEAEAGAPPIDDAEKSESSPESETEAKEAEPQAAPAKVAKPAATAAATKPVKPVEGSQAATISALALELAAADKVRTTILDKIRAAVGA